MAAPVGCSALFGAKIKGVRSLYLNQRDLTPLISSAWPAEVAHVSGRRSHGWRET